jgi:lipopolysaccharide export system protein LptA
MKRLLLSALLPGVLPVVLLIAAGPAAAEKADAFKPTQITCRACDANSQTGTVNMAGGVEIVRGTLKIDADGGRVEQSPEGYQRILLQAAPGNKVRFRQKADGPGERWMEGEADRVEYDDRSATLKLFSKAKVRRTLDGLQTEQAEGEYISYDSRSEMFTMRNTSTGEDHPGGGRNTIILQSKRRPAPAPAVAATDKP